MSKIGVNGSQKRRLLKICEFVSLRNKFPTFLRLRLIQEYIYCDCLCVIEKSLLLHMSGGDFQMLSFSRKIDLARRGRARASSTLSLDIGRSGAFDELSCGRRPYNAPSDEIRRVRTIQGEKARERERETERENSRWRDR